MINGYHMSKDRSGAGHSVSDQRTSNSAITRQPVRNAALGCSEFSWFECPFKVDKEWPDGIVYAAVSKFNRENTNINLDILWVKSLWLYLLKTISTVTKLDNELISKYPDVWHYVSKIYSPTPASDENLPPDVWHHVDANMSFRAAHG